MALHMDLLDRVDNIFADLLAETYLLRLMSDYGDQLEYPDFRKDRAFENVFSYQQQHIEELDDLFRFRKIVVSDIPETESGGASPT